MRAAILALVTAGALIATAADADARPPRYRNNWNGVRFYPSISSSPYAYGGYYGGYYPRYYSGYYPGTGFSFNVGGVGVSIGNNYVYPAGGFYSPYSSGYYPRYYGGYYGSYYGNRYRWGW
jgi:hypothetical protein